MLECFDLCLTYRKRPILRHVDFTARPHEITVLLGRNGSGKTSLLRCLAGERHPCWGTIRIAGENSRSIPPARRSRLLSLLPQSLPHPPVTVGELAAFGRQPYTPWSGRLSQADYTAITDALTRTGLTGWETRRVDQLSGGERQLAFLTMILVQNTPVVLLDEPTASLDAEYRRIVYRLLRELRDAGKTITVVLHDLTDAVELADQIVVLHHGKAIFHGTPDEFVQSSVPETFFCLRPVFVPPETGDSFIAFRAV